MIRKKRGRNLLAVLLLSVMGLAVQLGMAPAAQANDGYWRDMDFNAVCAERQGWGAQWDGQNDGRAIHCIRWDDWSCTWCDAGWVNLQWYCNTVGYHNAGIRDGWPSCSDPYHRGGHDVYYGYNNDFNIGVAVSPYGVGVYVGSG